MLAEVALPDLSRTDRTVGEQARQRYGAVVAAMKSAAPPSSLGTAYGELGMLLQAAEFYDAAEPCLLNAQALLPADSRWPYYLAHLYKSLGSLDKAEQSFERVLELRADDLATLVWLGRLSLDIGNVEKASRMFTRAAGIAPDATAVLAGLGQVHLAERNFSAAARSLERALSLDPQADSLHAPLAAAYRGLGDQAKAEPHERRWGNRDILVPDPLNQELDMLLDTGLSNELRGVRALEAEDWTTAAAYFRKGLAVTTENTSLRRSLQHKLGTALYLGGDVTGAASQFEQVIRAAPRSGQDEATAKAHYSLAIIRIAGGRTRDAIQDLQAAVTYQPTYLEARLALAEALRRTGSVAASLAHYRQALELSPQSPQGQMGHAFALIYLGRYSEAKGQLTDAVSMHPDRPELAHMLARLLAVAPDDRVRDGQHALRLVDDLLKGPRTTELGETLAMALAELGQFERAASIQRDILAVARKAGGGAATHRIEQNLRLYESGRPCRTFWDAGAQG